MFRRTCNLCHQERLGFSSCGQCGEQFCIDCCVKHEASCGMFEKASGAMSLRPYQEAAINSILKELGCAIDTDNDADGDGQDCSDGASRESLAPW